MTPRLLFLGLFVLIGSFLLTFWFVGTGASISPVANLANSQVSDDESLSDAAISVGLRPSLSLKGAVDQLARLNETQIRITGWSADSNGNGAPITVIAFTDGRVALQTNTNGPRSDVTDHFKLSNDAALNIGFGGVLACRAGRPLFVIAVAGNRYTNRARDSRDDSVIHGGRLNGGRPWRTRGRLGTRAWRWLRPFLKHLGHKARQRMCPLYVAGLIGPGDRKSVQPMAERFAPGDYDQLHHFVAAGVWNAARLETELLVQADKLVGGNDAILVIDDTAIPKKGKHSVGVAAQYASALGKTANCQTLVSLTLARGEVPVTVALRLFLPESWTSDRARLKRVGVPAEHWAERTKPEIALAEIDRMIAARVHFGCVLADAGYGLSAPFRQGLTARGLAWAVGIPRHLKVYPVDVQLIWPIAKRGRPRQR